MSDFDSYVFVDCETSGLDIGIHDLLDVSWAIGEGEIKTIQISRSEFVSLVVNEWYDSNAFRMNGYGKYVTENGQVTDDYPDISRDEVVRQAAELHADLKGRTMVGANPAFDAKFISKFLRSRDYFVGDELVRTYDASDSEPWHYRLFDIQAVFGGWVYGAKIPLPSPYVPDTFYTPQVPPLMGLTDIVKFFQKKGYDVNSQGEVHSSANDVEITRRAFFAMLDYKG